MSGKCKKVFLLRPPLSAEKGFGKRFGSILKTQMPLGIYYIASYIRGHGYKPAVCEPDPVDLNIDDILERIERFDPKYVGISSTTVDFKAAIAVTAEIKKRDPGRVTVIGGAHVSSVPEDAMMSGVFDYGVIGEGEKSFLELLETVNSAGDLGRVNGIIYRSGTKYIMTNQRSLIQDLDSIPMPAFDLVENMDYYRPHPSEYFAFPAANIITSRGCPNLCTFCSRKVFGNTYRERSAGNIASEIEYLVSKHGIRQFIFIDDTFLVNKRRIQTLFKMLDEKGISIVWTCHGCIENVDLEFLKFLSLNGCKSIGFGIESGDEAILKNVRKNISLDRVREVVKYCNQLSIKVRGLFMIGHPGETDGTIDKTRDLVLSLGLNAISVTLNVPYPGTEQAVKFNEYGTIKDLSNGWMWSKICVPSGLDVKTLFKKQKDIYLKFYFRAGIMYEYFCSIFRRRGMTRLRAFLKLVYS